MPAPEGEAETVDAVVDRLVYANEETTWSVARVHLPGRVGAVTAVGRLLGLQPGERVRLTGRWEHDRKYGRQFRVEAYLGLAPETLDGLRRYLGSGLVPGLGKVMAGRIVEKFGLDTLDVIENYPARLSQVTGIGRVRSRRIQAAWRKKRATREVMIFLQSHGISPRYADRIIHRFGEESAVAVVKSNPYRLADEIHGIGFSTADQIAESLGISPEAPARGKAGVLFVLGRAADRGHLFLPRAELEKDALALLHTEAAHVEQAVEALLESGAVVAEQARPKLPIYLPALHAAETLVRG